MYENPHSTDTIYLQRRTGSKQRMCAGLIQTKSLKNRQIQRHTVIITAVAVNKTCHNQYVALLTFVIPFNCICSMWNRLWKRSAINDSAALLAFLANSRDKTVACSCITIHCTARCITQTDGRRGVSCWSELRRLNVSLCYGADFLCKFSIFSFVWLITSI